MYINYLIVLVLLSFLSVIYIKLADKFNIIDKPNHRSSHTTPTIRGGGILFLLGILIYFVISDFRYPYFVIGVSLIAIISFIDDIITLSSSLRLPFQFLAIGLCLFQIGFTLENYILILPLLIVGVGFINIYNFMDGINGITGLYSIVSLIGLLIINSNEKLIDNNLLIYVLFSVLIFGFYNFRKKARMFAGDIGSISIAVLLFFVGAFFMKQIQSPLILLLISVYGADAILTIIYRKSIGEKLTEAHRHHVYQKMVHTLKIPHLRVSIVYAVIQLVINFIVYYSYRLNSIIQYIIFGLVLLILISLYVLMFKKVEKKKKLLTA